MSGKLRTTGILFAIVFLIGAIVSLSLNMSHGAPFESAVAHPYNLILLAAAAAFTASAFVPVLRWIQPAIFIGLSAIPIIQETRVIYGLGFYITGVLLLERAGFFLKHRAIKVAASVLLLFAFEVVGAIRTKDSPIDALGPTFFIAAFGLFLWFLYKDRLVVYLSEPKAKLSLTAKGLSNAERAYVAEAIKGKQQKEIAIDFEVAESTVRNTLARAYHKLGVEDKAGLAVLAEKFEIVE